MSAALILLCAGKGSRMRRSVPDKVLAVISGRTVFERSLDAFMRSKVVDRLVITFRSPAQQKLLLRALNLVKGAQRLPVTWVRGGKERQDSVEAALAAVPTEVSLVMIHDCARPLVNPAMIRRLATAAGKHGAAVLGHRITDTIKETHGRPGRPALLRTIDRDRLWAVETPQAFKRSLICRAFALIREKELTVTDDTQAVELAGGRVAIVENSLPNPKITSPADIQLVEFLLTRAKI